MSGEPEVGESAKEPGQGEAYGRPRGMLGTARIEPPRPPPHTALSSWQEDVPGDRMQAWQPLEFGQCVQPPWQE